MASTPNPEFFNQRTLAAIVFTDVVGFSARMQRDEVATLKLLQHDFAEMRRICTEHEGSVLKTTGDGLLMRFSSAVQAVACSLSMQRLFTAEAKDKKPGVPLQHRVGIHLGDVLVQDQDVMGDGVNIASRLQAEAEPGGICISQTVYDVVKNKLELQAVSLGPRDLKNISHSVPAYRILLEAEALSTSSRPPVTGTAPPSPAKAQAATPQPQRAAGGHGKLIAGGVLLVAAGAAASFFFVRNAGPDSAPAAAVSAPRSAAEEALEQEFAMRKEMLQARTQFLDSYDFDGFAQNLRDMKKGENVAGRAAQQAMLRSVEQMSVMKDWLVVGLRRYNRQRPLVVRDPAGDTPKDVSLFMGADKRFSFIEGNAVQVRDWSEIKPATMAAVILAVAKDTKPMAPRDAMFGAQAFARIYNQPSLLEAVTALLPNGGRVGAAQQGQGQGPGGQGQRGGRIGDGAGGQRRPAQ